MRWGSTRWLDGLSLTLPKKGERLAVVGAFRNAVKSTVLANPRWPAAAQRGWLRDQRNRPALLRNRPARPPDVRLVFQNPALLGSLTVGRTIGFTALSPQPDAGNARFRGQGSEALEAVGLLRHRRPSYRGELSDGMQKRVSFGSGPDRRFPASRLASTTLLASSMNRTAGLDPVACNPQSRD